MGYFRRFKLSDHTADECRKQMLKRASTLATCNLSIADTIKIMDEWACFRELLARHENQNESKLDKK